MRAAGAWRYFFGRHVIERQGSALKPSQPLHSPPTLATETWGLQLQKLVVFSSLLVQAADGSQCPKAPLLLGVFLPIGNSKKIILCVCV
jgi:hypothetical protein